MAPASTSSTICVASASFKKKPGTLTLTKKGLTWTTKEGKVEVDIPNSKLLSLFTSKEGGAKVILRVGYSAPSAAAAKGATATTTPAEDFVNITFTAASSAISDREHFKTEISQIVVRNRAAASAPPAPSTPSTSTPSGATGAGAKDKGKGKATGIDGEGGVVGPIARLDPKGTLRGTLLGQDKDLADLHRELVISGQMGEEEFWEGREHILQALAQAISQAKGRSAQMVDPRPTTGDNGEIKIKITPQLIHDIFEQYPVVQKAYHETVPNDLSGSQFWTRYFQSRLFHRNRTSGRSTAAEQASIKVDDIFDKYLEEEDDDLEPKGLPADSIYRLLDLAATQEDHGETGNMNDFTMRAGAQRSTLPLIRKFNEHSQRLLVAALGKEATKKSVIDGGKAGGRSYYNDILLEDLEDHQGTDRIVLDMQDREKYFEGGRGGTTGKRKIGEVEAEEIFSDTKRKFTAWEPDLGNASPLFPSEFEIDPSAVADAMERITKNIDRRYESKYGSKDSGIPESILVLLTSCHSSSNEFLRHFWSAVLPPRPEDISAAAMATPEQRAAKAQRMIGYLQKTDERVKDVVRKASSEGVDVKKVEMALRPMQNAVAKAITYFQSRTSAPSR